jgi:hypothetical protein
LFKPGILDSSSNHHQKLTTEFRNILSLK